MAAHEVVETGDEWAACRCGEVFRAASYDKARLDHVRHALALRHDVLPEGNDEEVPF